MKALFRKGLVFSKGDRIEILPSDFHHLIRVLRAEDGEKVLLCNGKGIIGDCKLAVCKKSAELVVENIKKFSRKHSRGLILGIPKKDALEQSIKMAVELNLKNVTLLKTEFSQRCNLKKIDSYIKQGVEQSNSAFVPEIKLCDDISSLEGPERVYFLNSKPESSPINLNPDENITLLIGPEGGFSKKELDYLCQDKRFVSIHFPEVAILRTPTAIAYGFGKFTFPND
jgi:16S rRNA (uracil1498-N3)-methyltransferase